MTKSDFTDLVEQMRITQKEYIKSGRNFNVLQKQRSLESQVDHEINRRKQEKC